jgi:hypothetical protein
MDGRVTAAIILALIGKLAAGLALLLIIIAGIWLWNNKGDDPFP